MGKLSRRRLVAATAGLTAGVATSLTGVFIWSIPLGLILTGAVISAAAVFLIRLDGEETTR